MSIAAYPDPVLRALRGDQWLTKLSYGLLWLTLVFSGIVLAEPAPYDGLIFVVMVIFFMSGLPIPRRLGPVLILFVVFVIGGMFSSMAAIHGASPGFRHFGITAFLALSMLFFASYVAANPQKHLKHIFSGYLVGATISAMIAIAAYFGLFGDASGNFVLYDRARGTFKDPNVLGPFLIAPAVYAMSRIFSLGLARGVPWAAFLGFLSVAIFLTFSRAAWGHLIFSLALYVYLHFMTANGLKDRFQTIAITLIAACALAGMVVAALSIDKVANLFKERASVSQSYDTGEFGRFNRHLLAIDIILDNPLGIGATEFERIYSEQPHNSYIYAFIIAGWAGGFAYLALVFTTLAIGFQHAFISTPWQAYYRVAYASFVGVALEGMIIDTDHWRHFYLLMGLVWGMFVANRRHTSRAMAAFTPSAPPIM